MSSQQEITIIDGQHDIDRFVCGYPKTGRTWLRYMLANYLVDIGNIDIDLTLNNVYSVVPNEPTEMVLGQDHFMYDGLIPKVVMSHSQNKPAFSKGKLVFLTRDPRDIMVSHWLHNRNHVFKFSGSISEFIISEQGIEAYSRHLDGWSGSLQSSQVLTYESMLDNPLRTLSRALEILGIYVNLRKAENAVENSQFKRMQEIEISHGIAGHLYDRSNPEARRVRKGLVGGFIDYLNADDIKFIDQRLQRCNNLSKAIISLTSYRPSNS